MSDTTITESERHDHPTRTLRESRVDSGEIAGLLFVTLASLFLTASMLAAAMAPGYDFRAAAISDLGVIPATALLFNATLVTVGLLDVLGGYFFYRVHGKRWILALFALAGLGAAGAGVFPLSTGDLHGLFALLGFLFFNLQTLGSATRVSGAMRALAVLAGGLGLVFVVLMVLGDAGNAAAFGPFGHGGTERMIVYPAMLWLVALGGFLLASADATTAVDEGVEAAD